MIAVGRGVKTPLFYVGTMDRMRNCRIKIISKGLRCTMFRKMRRFKQQITDEQCIEVLKNSKRGVLSLIGETDHPVQ